MTPYEEAVQWINHHPGTVAAQGMAALLLSLWNSAYAFSFRECTAGMDEFAMAVALRVVSYYARTGDQYDLQLLAAGQALCERYPRLNEVAEACAQARIDLQDKWQAEDEAASSNEPPTQAT